MTVSLHGNLRKIMILTAVVLFLCVLVPGAAAAQEKTALYYCDDNDGTNLAPDALLSLGFDITEAANWTDFNTKLDGGSYDLVIAFNQNGTLGADYAIMAAYIAAGGRFVFTNYGYEYADAASFAALFGAEYSGDRNEDSFTITDPQLGAGLPDPMQLHNLGWRIYSMCMIPGSGTSLARFANDTDAVILGNEGRTAILGFLADTLEEEYGQLFFENLFGLVAGLGGPVDDGDEENGDIENGDIENGDMDKGDIEEEGEKEKPSPSLPQTSGALPGPAALGLLLTAAGLLTWNRRK